jgi:formylglycine-generating enzyme required for sulfatase activity
MIRIFKTGSELAQEFVVLSLLLGSVMAQGGTGRKPTTPPTPPKRSTPTSASSCSAQSPKQGTGRTHSVDLGGVRLELVEIPAGSFCMGSEKGKPDEQPVHRVTFTDGFYMGKYEVTQAQWQKVMGNNPSNFKGDGNLPVEDVSWVDAQDFVEKLNRLNDGFKYRLPSEAEWEYACRAGTTGDGDTRELEGIAWYRKNSAQQTHPVGSKKPNTFGLYDMYGNVWEWCQDWYHDSYVGAHQDGTARLSAGSDAPEEYRAIRGESWFATPNDLRPTLRGLSTPEIRNLTFGFRVVAVAGPK